MPIGRMRCVTATVGRQSQAAPIPFRVSSVVMKPAILKYARSRVVVRATVSRQPLRNLGLRAARSSIPGDVVDRGTGQEQRQGASAPVGHQERRVEEPRATARNVSRSASGVRDNPPPGRTAQGQETEEEAVAVEQHARPTAGRRPSGRRYSGACGACSTGSRASRSSSRSRYRPGCGCPGSRRTRTGSVSCSSATFSSVARRPAYPYCLVRLRQLVG